MYKIGCFPNRKFFCVLFFEEGQVAEGNTTLFFLALLTIFLDSWLTNQHHHTCQSVEKDPNKKVI